MLFFFYGTLIAGNANPVARAVHARLQPRGPATVPGRLHAIGDPAGWYPALVAGDGVVHGQLYAATAAFSAADLAALDAFENCDPARPEHSDYLRRPLAVTTADGTLRTAEAYLWRRPLPAGAPVIAGGDFARWLADAGLGAYHAG